MPRAGNAEISRHAEAFIRFLDANAGEGAEWPINIDADTDKIDELMHHMNVMRRLCGIETEDHYALYLRPPDLPRAAKSPQE